MKLAINRVLFCCMLLLSLQTATTVCAQPAVPDNADGRLWRLAKVWGYLKYYHPRVCTLNWDSLLHVNIPLVINAADNADFNSKLTTMLRYVEQITPAQASAPPAADSNLNLDLGWTSDPTFSLPVRQFLDTFKSRAGRNNALACRITLLFERSISFEDDALTLPIDYGLETDRLTTFIYYWNVLNYFFPYRNLMDRPWDSTLLQLMPDVRLAANDSSFLFVLAKAQSRIDDSHGVIAGFSRFFYGAYLPGIRIERLGKDFVITKVRDSASGIRAGDKVLKINGQTTDVLAGRFRDIIAASNDPAFYRDVNRTWLRGAERSLLSLELSNASNQVYTRELVRDMRDTVWRSWWYVAPGKAWKVLCNGYGYIDLGKMLDAESHLMYDELKDKPAIVIDARRYPVGFDYIRYFLAGPVLAARYFVPDVKAPGWFKTKDDADWPPWTNNNPYPGKLFFLVNEETQSSGEYFVQYLSRIPGAKLIGSQTAGADGNTAMFTLPNSDFVYSFSNLGWYDYDWYQCQRNGLRIDETVYPTLAGISAGRDEVLEHVTGCPEGGMAGPGSLEYIRVYPNPATEKLNIDIGQFQQGSVAFRINDITGRHYKPTHIERVGALTYRLGLVGLGPGIYFLQVTNAGGASRTIKFSRHR